MKQNITFRISQEKREKVEALRQKKLEELGMELTLSGILNYLLDLGIAQEKHLNANRDDKNEK